MTIAILLKGYPRLSETFIAQEIAALEARGLALTLVSLRHPTDKDRHPVNARITAPVSYLPEYLYQEPLRLWRAWRIARRLPGYRAARRQWWRDLRRDLTPNRVRRFGQALVLAAELPEKVRWLHAHFLHTPSSVARYAGMMRGLPWSASAHARDIWTTSDWELAEKLADCRWAVTCTQTGQARLRALAPAAEKVTLVYHGLDFDHLPPAQAHGENDGSSTERTVRILSVGRAVAKKGYDDLLSALVLLPADLHWHFVHVGGGPLSRKLRKQATALGISARVSFLGAKPQPEVFAQYRDADLFVLACKIDRDGDRDGLPNVLMEAQSQGLACIATDLAGIPELMVDGATGLLSPPGDVRALAAAIERLARDPTLRAQLGAAGNQQVRSKFSFQAGIDVIAARLNAGEDRA